MTRAIRIGMAHFAAVLLFAAFGARAETAAEATTGSEQQKRAADVQAAIEANTAEVKAMLKQSADFLAAQEKFSFEAQTGFDVVQSNGQNLAFFERKKALVRRPDRLRVETDEADGDVRIFRFDGRQATVEFPGENAYVAVEKPGTTDAVIDYFVDTLETPVPLHEFVGSNYYDSAEGAITTGFYVAEVAIGERQCHHLAFRMADVDVQVWIEDGDRPLPCSLVITYKKAEGNPQYWAQFVDWDLSPSARDKEFEFTPPEGAERLSIRAAAKSIREETEAK